MNPHTLLRAPLPPALLTLLLCPTLLLAQPAKPPTNERNKDLTPFSQGLFLPGKAGVIQKLEAAHDYIDTKKWDQAALIIQSLLDAPEDVFVPFKRKDADGKDVFFWNSQRAEAERLLGTLPPEALEFYRAAFAEKARQLLREARQERDHEKLGLVAQRYLCTPAGREAIVLLGTHHLDRGRPLSASLCFQRLLAQPGVDKLPATVLFQAAFAGQHCGDKSGADRAWSLLTQYASSTIELGDKRVGLDELRQELTRAATGRAAAVTDNLVYRGRPDRQGVGDAGTPTMEARWQSDIESDPLTRTWLDAAVRQHETRSQPVMPALFPVTVGGRVFARTTNGVAAWDLAGGKLLWDTPLNDSLDFIATDREAAAHLDRWVHAYLTNNPYVILENSVIGSLSSDGRAVYAVEDLPLPPYTSNYSAFLGKSGQGIDLKKADRLTASVYHTRLVAMDAAGGKTLWVRGERSAVPYKPQDDQEEDKAPFEDSFILGPPLPLGGKLYLLSEKNEYIRLLCLDPKDGEVQWTQRLALSKTKMVLDGGRRLHAAHLAYCDGVLVCPTNAGGVIAVDLLSHSLLWAHAYREEPLPIPQAAPEGGIGFRPRTRVFAVTTPNLSYEWRNTAPLIADGKVIFGAPDDGNLHCVSLRDGKPLWKTPRLAGEQYPACVTRGKVLVVGNPESRLLSLEDGKPLGTLTTGQPSGQGVLAGGRYLLPLRNTDKNTGPAVCVIDLAGEVSKEVIASPRVPGNLLIQDDTLVSQAIDGVTAFPLKPANKEGK